MRLIMAISGDGYLAKGPLDNMSWSGPTDKALFKLLTLSGPRTLLAGSGTYAILPRLHNRRIIQLTQNTRNRPDAMTLGEAAAQFPGLAADLIGGPTIASAAIRAGLVHTAVFIHVKAEIQKGWPSMMLNNHLVAAGLSSTRIPAMDIKYIEVWTRNVTWKEM